MAQVSVNLPSELQHWMETRVADGHFVDADDYLRTLVRRDHDDEGDEVRRVRALIEEGMASGIVDAVPEDVLREIMSRIPASHG